MGARLEETGLIKLLDRHYDGMDRPLLSEAPRELVSDVVD
jgi:hypothetical protein